MLRNVFFTVIVPVYNGEKYLYQCLDRLITIDFDDYEILVVDNGSTDSTAQILSQYQSQYPDLINVYHIEHTNSPASGRNYGFHHANGLYTCICDVDDTMSGNSLREYYKVIQSTECDVCESAFFTIIGENKKLYSPMPVKTKVRELIREGCVSFWNKAVKTSLYLETGDIPENLTFDDFAYMPGLFCRMKKRAVIDVPLYFHVESPDSESHSIFSNNLTTMHNGFNYTLERCPTIFHCEIAYRYFLWYASRIDQSWCFADQYLEDIKNISEYLVENPYITAPKHIKLLKTIESYDFQRIPNIIYVNGFGETLSCSDTKEDIEIKAFTNGGKVIVLNKENCDISENKFTELNYFQGNIDFVASYFAMKKILETGGIFLGRNMKISAPFNSLRMNNCFFSYESNTVINGEFFGGKVGNKYMSDIIDLIEQNGFELKLSNLSDCILYSLLINENYVVCGNKKNNFNNFSILPISENSVPSIDHMQTPNFCYKYDKDTCLTIVSDCSVSDLKSVTINTLKSNEYMKSACYKELRTIKNSNSWKFVQYLKRFSRNGIGRFFKKIYIKFFKDKINEAGSK